MLTMTVVKLLVMRIDDDCGQTAWKLLVMSVVDDCCQIAE